MDEITRPDPPGAAAPRRLEMPDPEGAVLKAARRFAESCFAGSRGSHAWDHTQRVCRLCERIGRVEGADMPVLRSAALLHDIGRMAQDESAGVVCHAERGEQMARPVVGGFALSPARRENILHCIRSHRFRGERPPRTVEARVLFDADKLDAIGAIGVARAFLFAGEVGARLHAPELRPEETRPYSQNDTGYREFRLKLSRVREHMLTAEGRRLAEERHRFMSGFFERFLAEYEGGC
ncbi:MAG: HD domain-containing protein [Desulfobacterales bacterium]